jgi:hypothetical protein
MKLSQGVLVCMLLFPAALFSQIRWQTTPDNNVIFELASSIRVVKADALSIAAVVMKPNRMFRITFSKPVTGRVHIVLYDISGKVLASWDDFRPAGNQAELALPARAKGCMIVRVHAGQQMIQKKFVIAR